CRQEQKVRVYDQRLKSPLRGSSKPPVLPEVFDFSRMIEAEIARALAGNPKLILADEPTAALDYQRGHTIMELLRKLAKKEGCTVLMVTHDPRIMDIADRVVYVEDGLITPKPANPSFVHEP
uniref:AAA family ATPase n=1 Tax=Acaryochloris sp. IP29b_bin.137 TaxID=2969217 RepID=UPI003450D4AC